MSEPTCTHCERCDKWLKAPVKTSCQGQTGTFDPEQCPDIPCATCAACEQKCKQAIKFWPEDCPKSHTGGYIAGDYIIGVDIGKGSDCTVMVDTEKLEGLEGLRTAIRNAQAANPNLDLTKLERIRNITPVCVTLSTRKEVFAMHCYLGCLFVVGCEAEECPFFENGACNGDWKDVVEQIKVRCLHFLRR